MTNDIIGTIGGWPIKRNNTRKGDERMTHITIRSHTSGAILEIVRSSTATHPKWVHEQCETETEGELQAMLDQMSVHDFADGQRDNCGILIEENHND